jgi:hypothetical protein
MSDIEERIRTTARQTDVLIARLDTLSGRIETARENDNGELVAYYEEQFAEASAEFMEGVESILGDWYALQGKSRPPAEEENLTPEQLDEIHRKVVDIVQSVVAESSVPPQRAEPEAPPRRTAEGDGPRHKVDVTG